MKKYKIRRELVTEALRLLMPTLSDTEHPLKFWIDNNILKFEDLEEVPGTAKTDDEIKEQIE